MHHKSPPAPCACTTLRKASRAITRAYDQALADHDMTTTQFAILRTLSRGDLPLSRLAEHLVMDRTSLYRTLAPIIRQGWVEVHPDSTRRSKVATLTEAGGKALVAALPAWAATQTRIVDELGSPAWQNLQSTLEKLVLLTKESAT
ncbi:MAG: MarR family winged helix-turn-helix transcriptional regulator [Sphingobium sp.]